MIGTMNVTAINAKLVLSTSRLRHAMSGISSGMLGAFAKSAVRICLTWIGRPTNAAE